MPWLGGTAARLPDCRIKSSSSPAPPNTHTEHEQRCDTQSPAARMKQTNLEDLRRPAPHGGTQNTAGGGGTTRQFKSFY